MIEINLQAINNFMVSILNDFHGGSPLDMAFIFLFKYYGWVLMLYILIKEVALVGYMDYIQDRWYAKTVTPILLAIDVPRLNEQSIQAMENFFDHLQGAHGTFNWWQAHVYGEFQLTFSMEIVSIEGSVQYIIRTPEHWRNLVEAAIYAQFPEAEITEIEDYVPRVPQAYPNDTHDVWATEYSLAVDDVLPIKSWRKFEHNFGESTYVDPMAAMLETMSAIGPGEQIWLQFIIKPLPVNWGLEKGKAWVDKVLERKAPVKKGLFDGLWSWMLDWVQQFSDQTIALQLAGGAVEEKKQEIRLLPNISPGEKTRIEGVETKVSKLAFDTKIRFLYVAEKDKMNRALGVNAMVGVIKQWNDMYANNLKPMLKETGTNTPFYYLRDYRRNYRRTAFIFAYKGRRSDIGMKAKAMSSEDLASMWHFPSMNVKAPFLHRTAFMKTAAPSSLPIESGLTSKAGAEAPALEEGQEFVEAKTSFEPTFDYDNDDFEMQFAKDKETFIKTRPARKKQLEKLAQEEQAFIDKQKITKEPKKTEESKGSPNIPFID